MSTETPKPDALPSPSIAPSYPPVAETPAAATPVVDWLPPPATQADPALLARALELLLYSAGPPANRHYLTAVLPSMALIQLERLLHLDDADRATASSIVSSGLRVVRAWGGRQPKPSPLPHPAPATTASETTLAVNPYVRLARNMNIVNAVPLPVEPAFDGSADAHRNDVARRRAQQREACRIRQQNQCFISKHTTNSDQCSHVLSDSVAHPSPAAAVFWIMLALLYGEAVRDHLYALVGGVRSYSSANALFLDAGLHTLFDRGFLWLRPVLRPTPPSGAALYDVELQWMDTPDALTAHHYVTPQDPDDQVIVEEGGTYRWGPRLLQARQLQSGDRFRLFTNAPIAHPNPHPILLELRVRLWAMIFNAGLGASVRVKKRKERVDDRGGDEDDDGEDRDGTGDEQDGEQSQSRRGATRKKSRAPGQDVSTAAGSSAGTQAKGKASAATDDGSAQGTAEDDSRCFYFDGEQNVPAPSTYSSMRSSSCTEADPSRPPPFRTLDPCNDPWLLALVEQHERVACDWAERQKRAGYAVSSDDDSASDGSLTWDDSASASSVDDGEDGDILHDPWLAQQAARLAGTRN